MSRCFEFPPPGYAGKCSSNEALILSIKLQREKKANPERKREKVKSSDRKKEEKRQRKEKKSLEKRSNYAVDGEKQKLVKKLYDTDKYKALAKGKSVFQENEPESLEKSGVTEELGCPADLLNNSCSSDRTGNSNKRKLPSTPSNRIQSQGSVFQFRLSSWQGMDKPSTSGHKEETCLPAQKRDDASTSFTKIQPCSNAVRIESSAQEKDVIVNTPRDVSNVTSTSNSSFDMASRQAGKKAEAAPPKKKISSHEKRMPKWGSIHSDLFESWIPPTVQSEPVVDDEEWLFGRDGEERPAKTWKVGVFDSSIDSLQCCASAVNAMHHPSAHFLANAEIYALPFTVPF